jgi:hypothetical protein
MTNFTKNKPSFCQNKKIVAITSHFLKFQAQAAINTLISSPTCPLSKFQRDNRYQRDKKRKLCKRRAAIEPIIGHLKSNFRLSRNLLKGQVGDEINGCLC